jgi:hypothetical protein
MSLVMGFPEMNAPDSASVLPPLRKIALRRPPLGQNRPADSAGIWTFPAKLTKNQDLEHQ